MKTSKSVETLTFTSLANAVIVTLPETTQFDRRVSSYVMDRRVSTYTR